MTTQVSSFNNATVFSDIDPSFTRNPKTGDLLLVKDDRSVKQSISNLLNTSFGERLFQPLLGGALRRFLFEPIDPVTTIEMRDCVFDVIRKYEPRVGRLFVDITAYPGENTYTIDVEYGINPIGRTDKLTVVLERIR